MGQGLPEHDHRVEFAVESAHGRVAQQGVVVLGDVHRAGALRGGQGNALVVEVGRVLRVVDVVRMKAVFLHVSTSSDGLEEHLFQRLGGIQPHQDAVPVAAFFQFSGAGVVETLPHPGRKNKGHVGVVQAVKCPGGHEPFQNARRAGTRQAGHPKKCGLRAAAALAPALDLAPHEAHVHVGMVQEHAVQELVQCRVAGRTEARGRSHSRKGSGQEKSGCAPQGHGHDSLPREQHVQLPSVHKQPLHTDQQCTHPQQEKKGEEGAKKLASGGLEGLEFGVVVTVGEHAVEDGHAVDGQAVQERCVPAQQQ